VRYILEVREESPDEIQEFFRQRLGPPGVEGFMTGAQQLTQQVRAAGRAEGKAEAILRVLGRRGVELTEEQRALVLATSDIEALDRWLDRAILAVSASDVLS
jgi:hypothetical protein